VACAAINSFPTSSGPQPPYAIARGTGIRNGVDVILNNIAPGKADVMTASMNMRQVTVTIRTAGAKSRRVTLPIPQGISSTLT